MSLYTEIANSLTNQGISTGIGAGINSTIGDTLGKVAGNSTFGKAIANVGTSMARNAVVGIVNKYIPGHMQRMIGAGTGAIGDILNGDFSNAGLRLFDSGVLDQILPGMGGVGSQARFFGTPTPLFGGLAPAEAKQIYQEMQNTPHVRKNLWLIEVGGAHGDASSRFNMFATDLDYSAFTITGEKRQIGGANADSVNSSEPVELRMTTYDDTSGFIKSWFKWHAEATVSGDGTVGVPADYAIKIKIVHGFVTNGSNRGGYEDIGLFRVGNIDTSLSRREDGLEEITMSFVQLDTFVEPSTFA